MLQKYVMMIYSTKRIRSGEIGGDRNYLIFVCFVCGCVNVDSALVPSSFRMGILKGSVSYSSGEFSLIQLMKWAIDV